jgi:hypothetical protein
MEKEMEKKKKKLKKKEFNLGIAHFVHLLQPHAVLGRDGAAALPHVSAE